MTNTIKILYLGDIFGMPGREVVREFLPSLIDKHDLDLVLANCENAAQGRGISERLVNELLGYGVDFMTSGNHIYHVDGVFPYLNKKDTKVLRPYNFSRNSPGRGVGVIETKNGIKVGVINIMGRVFMEPSVDLPFDAVDEAILEIQGESDILVLDMHAETTSEKRAMGWHLDGRVSLVVGTHTHVQTADEEILPNGTGYITDLGMCGPYESVIGMAIGPVLKRFRMQISRRFEVAQNDARLCGVICEIDTHTKKAVKIERVCERMAD
jgi:2',3'-cyclic-nucleotide 2'-phosphodiesterase